MKRVLLLATWLSLSALGQSDPGYVRSTVPNQNICLFWSTRSFVYSPDAAGNAENPGGEFTAIDAAFTTWQTLSNLCSDMRLTNGGRIPNPVVGYDKSNPSSNTNVVTFRQTNCLDVAPSNDACLVDSSCGNKYACWSYGDDTIALTTTTFSNRTGAILDADIELNASPHLDGSRFLFTTMDSPPCDPSTLAPTCVATDIQNTLTHEIGHAIGLGHSPNPSSTMNATAPIGETHKRILDSGSAQGFCDIYPRGQPATNCDTTSQERLQVNGVQARFLGCETMVGASYGALALLAVLLRRRR